MEIQAGSHTVLWPMMALVAAATVTDLRSRRIPNQLVLLGLVASAILHGWSGLWQSVLGVLLAAVIQGAPCYFGWLGMGDLKLCAVIGTWIGPWQLTLALMMTSRFVCVIALSWAAAGGFLYDALRGTAGLLLGKRRGITLDHPAARKMPYAPAIALGTVCSFLGRQI